MPLTFSSVPRLPTQPAASRASESAASAWWRSPLLIASAAYALLRLPLSLLSLGFTSDAGVASVWYLPVGLDVAGLMVFGWRFAPTMVIVGAVQWLGFDATGWTPDVVFSEQVINFLVYYAVLIGVMGGAREVLVRKLRVHPFLPNVRDVAFFGFVMAGIAPLVRAFLYLEWVVLRDLMSIDGLLNETLAFWAGDATGVAVVTPAALLGLTRLVPHPVGARSLRTQPIWTVMPRWKKRWPETVAIVLLAAAVVLAIFVLPPNPDLNYAGLLFIPILWVALRHGYRATIWANLLLNLVIGVSLAWGDAFGNLFALQVALLALAIAGAQAGALASEQRITFQRYRKAERAAREEARFKTNLLHNLSHEVRTPLGAIIGHAEIIAHDPEPNDVQEASREILISSERLLDTLTDVIDFSRAKAGLIQAEMRETNLAAIVDQLQVRCQVRAAERRLAYYSEAQAGVQVTTDAHLVERILSVLLSNAFKFTHTGSVSLSVHAAGGDAFFVVSDTGAGMTPSVVEVVSQPFRQASEGLSRSHEGMGLGLALCHLFADLIGAGLTFDSQPGEGTTVRVRLPGAIVQAGYGERPLLAAT